MKKLILICSALMITVSVFAAGSIGVNPPQKGVLYPDKGTVSITNTFAYPFQTTPLLVVYAGATNSTPITNSVLTTTNFVISWPVNGSTNASFSWSAFVGGTRMQSGAVTNVAAATSTSVVFPQAYATLPIVVMTPQGGTNIASFPSIVSISLTNFTYFVNASETNYWISIGTVANPQTEYQGTFPRSNPVIY